MAVGGFISDSNNDLRKFRIPDGTILAPGGFLVFYEPSSIPVRATGRASLSVRSRAIRSTSRRAMEAAT